MQSFRRSIRRKIRPAPSRARRTRPQAAALRLATKPEPDLSALILYGQA